MKLAIISDIHDNLPNLGKFINWAKKEDIKAVVCCGDVTNSETLRFLASNFLEKIFLVPGNVELYDETELKQFKNIIYSGRVGVWEIASKKIGVCHEPFLISKVLETGECDLVFYGHTHRPWEEEKQGVRLVNPGTLGGVFSRATFAVYDTETTKLNLHILDTVKI